MTVYQSPWGSVPTIESSVFDFLWTNPNRVPDSKPAFVHGLTGQVVTRQQLKRDSQRLAHALVHQFGMKQGEVVGVFSPNTLHYPVIVHAAQCAGLVFSGANAAYTKSELVHQLKEADAKVLFCHPDLIAVAHEAVQELHWSAQQQKDNVVFALDRADVQDTSHRTLDEIMTSDLLEPARIQQPREHVGFLCFSSGTTSAAKGVRTSHYNMTSVCLGLKPLAYQGDDVFICVLPLNHIFGLTKLCINPVVIGATVVMLPKFDIRHFCEVVQKYKVSTCLVVPPMILGLARFPDLLKYDFSSIKSFLSGGAPLSGTLQKELMDKIHKPVSQGYGLTETSPTTHYCPIDEPHPGSIGFLLPNVEGRIVDSATGKDCKEGDEGEVWLAGPLIMLGYHRRPEATKEAIVEGKWFRTGDIGYVQNNYWYISDRLKEMIKYKGLQVYPAELEGALLTHPKIADAAVVPVYSEDDASELPRAYVVANTKIDSAEGFEAEVQEYMANRLASHKRLRGGVFVIDEIPKSASGKILRRVLRDRKDPLKRRTRREAKL